MPQNAPHKKLLESCEEGENMVSNLPLLFAAGYPTSLDKITEKQLESFIPFMVQCSLGDIQLQLTEGSSEPEWWPEDIPFVIPLQKPCNFSGDWLTKLKEIVAICYQFHKSVFLLRFCENLAKYQNESLRFINNYNSTTSLYDRSSNKLLVTFRNENMLYDQPQGSKKKTLLPKSSEPQQMVQQSLFDIYLCDNCDAELYSSEAFAEHEKGCRIENSPFDPEVEDDDVIFCGEEDEPEDTTQKQLSFLNNFQLFNKNIPLDQKSPNKHATPHKRSLNNNVKNKNGCSKTLDTPAMPDKKVRRVPRRTHAATILSKSQIPISSPAGQRIISISNSQLAPGYQRERIDRYERFCPAPTIAADSSNRPKFMDKKFNTYTNPSFRSNTKHFHYYKFPRRQFSTNAHDTAAALLQHIMFKETSCKPCTITLNRLTTSDIETLRIQSKVKRRKLSVKSSASSSSTPSFGESNIVGYIDLCSDSEGAESYSTSEDSNQTASSSGNRQDVKTAQEALLFVDCSEVTNETYSHPMLNVDTLSDARLQPTIIRSQCDSTSNKLQQFLSSHTQSINIFSNDKENRLFQFLPDQTTTNPQNASFLFETEIDNALDINAGCIDNTAIPANNNFISIDLT